MTVFVLVPGVKANYAAHPTEASANYRPPDLVDVEDTLLPVGRMLHNEDGSWTISLSAVPTGNVLIAKPDR
jgi:hypothetical protein